MQVRVLPIYGGQPVYRQIQAIRAGVDAIIGTPGRLLDHIQRGTLNLSEVRVVVLDEADEMLNMGFIEDIESILQVTPSERQTLLFSATMPEPIARLARRYMRDPIRISAQPEHVTAPDIEQVFYEARPHERFESLCRIIDSEAIDRAIVFCRTKRGVDELTDQLRARGFMAEAIHGDLDQRQRNRVMLAFRQGSVDLLIATDVAARGLDVENVTHVINYDVPPDAESYVHRIGRTGRAGRSGTAMTLVPPREYRLLRSIERVIGMHITRRRVPTVADVEERQRGVWRERLEGTLKEANLSPYRLIIEELAEEYDSIDVGAAALKLLMDEPGEQALPSTRSEFADTGAEEGMVRFFTNIGRRQGVGHADIVRSIAENAGIPGGVIGKIDIYDNFAFVEVPTETATMVSEAMRRGRIRGRQVNLEPARPV
jgi:ATP-dependent RNA helicase DeaD